LETAAQLADGAGLVWLLFGEEPLPDEYRPLVASPRDGRNHYAFVLELAAGDEFDLTQDTERERFAPGHAASPLDLLAFLLRSAEDEIRLSRHGGWALRRTGASGRRK
jgi:hypothetical protein